MMIDTATAIRFLAGAKFCSSTAISHYRHAWNLDEVNAAHVSACPLIRSGSFAVPWGRRRRLNGGSFLRSNLLKNRIRASSGHLGSASGPSKPTDGRLQYHPFEEIVESTSENTGDAMLSPQETARTIVEVNSKAILMLTGLINGDIHENIIWPDLPYVTDEQGNIYFQVKNDEDILQTLTSENNFVQAIVGFDAMEMISEMELLGSSEVDFGIEEIEDEDGDVEDDDDEDEDDEDEDYDEDLVAVIEDEGEEYDSDEALGDWAKLETMRTSHPMYFAKKLAQAALDDPIDWMEQPPAGLAIQGLIRPAFIEEHSDIQRHMSGNQSHHADKNEIGKNLDSRLEDLGGINGHKHESGSSEDISTCAEELKKDQTPRNGTSFYKMEMIKIQLISAHGHHTTVEAEDFREAKPDAIAHSAGKILSRLKAGGEKISQALKSLCWRCKGIQVEEAGVIGVDSLGFDLRVCSETQIQTLRFGFNSRATSEYSAERQLNDLLFPRIPHRVPKKKQTRQREV
ncbi:uncharacterized protein At3g49140 isoform X1 [Manihot esculenta]|uniref:FMN-binding split barrel n=1 Tax=Manihot esculenta TaxID=3983 RepID=A0A2C9UI90_MANES|nr:uncharacterized protein At3g49140 isoform X1 [Manihot esculenta]OAY30324.1 hypothetical protein MANES_14G021400v8 [Manihot esculenta]